MKYLQTLLLSIFLAPLLTNAQSNYKPGYVVKLNGDTVKGFIDYKEWDKNPKNISFKSLNESNSENFTVGGITAFGISNAEYFKRFNVAISQGEVEMTSIKTSADTTYITDNVFLRILTSGNNVTLFSYRDNIKTRYYILDNTADKPAELIYRVYYSPDNLTYVQTDNTYRVQLQTLAQKYNVNTPRMQVDLSTAQYSESDLVKIVQVINGNKNNKQFTPKKRFGIGFYAGVGVNDNNLVFTGAVVFPNNSNIGPKIAAGVNLFPNKNTQQLFLRAELLYETDQHTLTNIASAYSTSKIEQRTFSFTPQIVYNIYNGYKLSIFINGGVSINSSSYNKYYTTQTFTSQISETSPGFPVFDSLWASFPLKTGVIINKTIEVYVGYTPSAAVTVDNNYQGSLTVYQAGVNYFFGLK